MEEMVAPVLVLRWRVWGAQKGESVQDVVGHSEKLEPLIYLVPTVHIELNNVIVETSKGEDLKQIDLILHKLLNLRHSS